VAHLQQEIRERRWIYKR